MSEQQITTENDQKTKLLPLWYFEAFDLKIKGYKYAQIAKKVNRSVDRVYTVLAPSGPMAEYMREFFAKVQKEEFDDALLMAHGNLSDTMRLHIAAGQNIKSMVGLEARRDILKITNVLKKDGVVIENTNIVVNFTDWATQQIKEIKEYEAAKRSGTIDAEVSEGTA